MAQTERLAKALDWTNSSTQATEIASLRTAIATGNRIIATHLNRIGTLINNMNGHYHTYDDSFQLASFGNTGDRTNYIEDKSTNSIDAATPVNLTTAADTSITATRHNELRDSINNLRSHLHGINDRTEI
jgi:DNA anti-recombination protein RmuC